MVPYHVEITNVLIKMYPTSKAFHGLKASSATAHVSPSLILKNSTSGSNGDTWTVAEDALKG